jgi:hypothetical protein
MDKAVIIGINNAPIAPRLRGCRTDATALAERLVQRYGFAPENVRLLFDERATAAAIRERIGWLRAGNTEDDRIVFAFSGHGVRQTYRAHHGGLAGTHEALVAHDFSWDVDDSGIRDIWLASTFNDSGFLGHKTVILDCCHAGGMDRSFVRRVTRRTRTARGVEAPADIAWRRTGAVPESATRSVLVTPTRFTLFAACTATQTAADCYEDKAWRGAFSWGYATMLDQGGSKSPLSVIRDAENKFLAKRGYPQDPRAVGLEVGRPLFGGVR